MEEQEEGYEEIFAESEETETTGKETTSKEKMSKTKTDESENAEAQSPALITKEFAAKYGLSDTLVGKPFDELGKSYQNLHKVESKNAQNIAALTQQLGEFSEALTTKEVKQVAAEVEEELPDLSKFIDETGYINDIKGYNEAFAKREDIRERKLEKKFTKMLEEKEKLLKEESGLTTKQVAQMQSERLQTELYDTVTESLNDLYTEEEITPDLIDKIIKEYEDFLTEEDEESQSNYARLYAGKPGKMAKAIIMYHKANSYKKPTEAEKTSEAAKEAHKKQLEKLKKSDKTFTGASSSARQASTKASEDKDYDELLSEAEAERPQS